MRPMWVVGLVALLLAACGGGKDDRATTLQPATPAATSASGMTTPPAVTSTIAAITASTDLQKALLTLDDMPTGFTVDPPDADDEGGTDPCGRSTELRQRAVQNVEAGFAKGQLGPFVSHTIGLFRSGTAKDAMDYARKVFEECREWSDTTGDGTVLKFRLSPVSFPRLGDQTFAMRVDVDGGSVKAQGDLVYVRRKDVIFLLANTMGGLGTASVDSAMTEQLVRKADEKLVAMTR